MRNTLFSRQLRLVMCAHCGAPLEVPVDGGITKCSYCSHANRIVRRDESHDLEVARRSQQTEVSEAARIDALRSQDNRPVILPPDLMRFVAGGKLIPAMQQHAIQEWLATRSRVVVGAPFPEQERLFHLTMMIAPTLEDRHQRAMLEDAAETLPDARHRQVLRCRLAHRAILARDLDAAGEWLAPCNPRAIDLQMDTAYRLASSYLATAQGNPAQVLALLGHRPGDVPIADAHDAEADLLRADAIEKSGHVQAAVDHLLYAMRRDMRNVILLRDAIVANQPLAICPQSYPAAQQQMWPMIEREVRPRKVVSLGWFVLGAFIPAAGMAIVVAAITGVFGHDDAVVINAVVHPLIWLVITPLVTIVIGLLVRQKKLRLRDQGVLTVAHVLSSETQIHRGKNSTTVSQALTLAIELGGSYVHARDAIHRETPVPLGPYPCIVDPHDASNLVLKLKPML